MKAFPLGSSSGTTTAANHDREGPVVSNKNHTMHNTVSSDGKSSTGTKSHSSNDSNSNNVTAANHNMSHGKKLDPLKAVSRRIAVLRICFIVSLLAAAAVCGYISYMMIKGLEQDVGLQTYESVATSALGNARAIFQRKSKGGQVLSKILSHAFPYKDQWPFVALNGYADIAGEVAKQSSTMTQAVNPILRPDQIDDFEKFAYATFRAQNYPETAGVSKEFGFGVFGFDANGKRYHRTNSTTAYGSPNDIIVPVFQHNDLTATSILFDTHSKETQGNAIDSMLECNAAAKAIGATPKCMFVTDWVELIIKPGPAALIYEPVYPANDPYEMVAIMGTTLHWEEVLINTVPAYINSRITCVFETDSAKHTFGVRGGETIYFGAGDLHDRRYSEYGKTTILTDAIPDGSPIRSETYKLTIYPSEEVLREFHTNSPLAVSLGFVGVICFCTTVFFLYDYFVKNENNQRKAILQVKRRFVRFVSHEIRTPLNTVCLGLQLLRDDMKQLLLDKEKEEQQPKNANTTGTTKGEIENLLGWIDLAGDIVENSNDAVLVLNDLLSYDKIENGTLFLDLAHTDMHDLTRDVVSKLQPEAKNRNVNLRFDFDNQLTNEARLEEAREFQALVDGQRIRQVIRNIVSNALKFTPSNGDVVVSLIYESNENTGLEIFDHEKSSKSSPFTCLKRKSASTSKKSNEFDSGIATAKLQVKDSGIGMTPEQLSRLFGEGVQFDANKLQAGGGSGLGLWISKGIVESHGGYIYAESKGYREGCTFTFTLPLYPAEDTVVLAECCNDCQDGSEHNAECTSADGNGKGHTSGSEVPTPADTKANDTEQLPKKHHILVVDDSVMNRKMLIRLLERSGHTCVGVSDGTYAIEAVKATLQQSNTEDSIEADLLPFDTILMDYEMPEMNGPDASQEIRKMQYDGLIIGVTGNVLKEDVDYFKQMGANQVLSKPVRPSDIERFWK